MNKKGVLKIILYFALILVAVYTLVPFLTIVLTSFRTEQDLYRGPFTIPKKIVAFENFRSAWVEGRYRIYMKNSFIILIPSVMGSLIVTTLAGYSFAKLSYPGKNVFFALLILGMMIPFQSIMIPLYMVLRSLKLLNKLLGIILVQVSNVGFGVYLMRAFYVTLPDEIIDAARVDGCNEWKILAHIIFPITSKGWVALIVFYSLWSWNNLVAPMIFLYNESLYPIPYALYAFQGAHIVRYELLSAAMLISLFPLIIVYIIFQRNFTRGLISGAIKG